MRSSINSPINFIPYVAEVQHWKPRIAVTRNANKAPWITSLEGVTRSTYWRRNVSLMGWAMDLLKIFKTIPHRPSHLLQYFFLSRISASSQGSGGPAPKIRSIWGIHNITTYYSTITISTDSFDKLKNPFSMTPSTIENERVPILFLATISSGLILDMTLI